MTLLVHLWSAQAHRSQAVCLVHPEGLVKSSKDRTQPGAAELPLQDGPAFTEHGLPAVHFYTLSSCDLGTT